MDTLLTPFPEAQFRRAPKAELHVHLEGSMAPATLLALCHKYGVAPPAADEAGVRDWFRFDDFPHFLERYFFCCRLLHEPADFARLAADYLDLAASQGAVHVEFHVSASYHIDECGADWPAILSGIVDGCESARGRTGISALLIPDLSPHLGAARCARTVDTLLAHLHPAVTALGMGGPAAKWFDEDFGGLMDRARDAGLHVVSHAGEHGPALEVRHAVEVFGAERIQHGIAAVSDPDVVQLLVSEGIPCDVCPASNAALGAVPSPAAHPLKLMVDSGIVVTLGSDDPPMFQTDLLNEYRLAWELLDGDVAALARLARASIAHSFATKDQKSRWLGDFAVWAREANIVM